jgi:serine phosphatase RsbU (regulator of sigma subunit)
MPVAGVRPHGNRRVHAGSVIVLIVGLLITGGLALGARVLRNDNEDRLLRERRNEIAQILTTATSTNHLPLQSAALVADETEGSTKAFRTLVTPVVGSKRGQTYDSASLWTNGPDGPREIVVVGRQPTLAKESPDSIAAVLAQARAARTLSVRNLLEPARRLGYAAAAGTDSTYVAYAESQQLPRGRKARIARNNAFADFDYALYLGRTVNQRNLLASSTGGEVLGAGRKETVRVPFGDAHLTLVLAPRGDLGGTFLLRLPWFLLGLGLVLTVAAAALVEYLSRQRERAENLAGENARLLADQRNVAYELQHSLLPESLPSIAGVDLAVRYLAGVEGVDIGGDWYDVIPLDQDNVLLVMGDVSGRGLRAAAVMASLRYAIHAYAAQGDSPTVILTKLSMLLDVERDGGFATVLCAAIDIPARTMTLASAGHLPPLVKSNGRADLATLRTGLPVGVSGPGTYEAVVVDIPPCGTVLLYTDGLVERRGEILDDGLDRLRDTARSVDGSLEHLLTEVVDRLTDTGSSDDTAVLGVRWRT